MRCMFRIMAYLYPGRNKYSGTYSIVRPHQQRLMGTMVATGRALEITYRWRVSGRLIGAPQPGFEYPAADRASVFVFVLNLCLLLRLLEVTGKRLLLWY